jgi:hypothetical protein
MPRDSVAIKRTVSRGLLLFVAIPRVQAEFHGRNFFVPNFTIIDVPHRHTLKL